MPTENQKKIAKGTQFFGWKGWVKPDIQVNDTVTIAFIKTPKNWKCERCIKQGVKYKQPKHTHTTYSELNGKSDKKRKRIC